MRFLLSCGSNSEKTLSAMKRKFAASNDEFIVEQYIDDISNIFTRGDYFDKALINEASLTRDKTISDENVVRQSINRFAVEVSKRVTNQTFVFLTSSNEIANIIHEEIFPIISCSAITVIQPPYTVGTISSLLINDIGQIPDEQLFKPEVIKSSFDESKIVEEAESLDNIDLDDTFGSVSGADDLFGFGDDFGMSSGGKFSNDLNIDEGTGFGVEPEQQDAGLEGLDIGDLDLGALGLDEGDSSNTGDIDISGIDLGGLDKGDSSNNGDDIDISELDLSGFNDDSDIKVESVPKTDNTNNQFGGGNFGEGFGEPNEGGDIDLSGLDLAGFTDNDNIDGIQPLEQSGELPNYYEEETVKETQQQVEENQVPVEEMDNNMEQDNRRSTANISIPGFDDDFFGDNVYSTPSNEQKAEEVQQTPVNNYGQNNFGGEDNLDALDGNNEDEGLFGEDIYKADERHLGTPVEVDEAAAQAQQANAQAGKKKGLFGGKQKQQAPQEPEQPLNQQAHGLNVGKLKKQLTPFATRGNSLLFTGCGGCGTSTIAYSVGNVLNAMGFSVLIVDLDTKYKVHSYMTREILDNLDAENAGLRAAINSSNNLDNYSAVIKPGFRVLTMGMASDSTEITNIIDKSKINRFVNLAKSTYNFVIYDAPFEVATEHLPELTYLADSVTLIIDSSNWGVAKAMIGMANIPTEEMQDTMFSRAQIVFNKFRRMNRIFGKKVKTYDDITKEMDRKILDLQGEDIGLHFAKMRIAGSINDDATIEDGWCADVSYSDTAKGQKIFLEVIESVILNK